MNRERFIQVLTIMAMLVMASIFLHRTHNYLGTVPIATDDDAISNVAVNLWKNGMYGYPASPSMIHYGVRAEPILKAQHFDQTHHYYNYGWFYFVVSGFFNWMLGDDSMAFFRMMNPWGLLFVVGLGFWFFRGISLLPGALLGVGIMGRFLLGVSPVMSRPDIAVSVATAIFFVGAYFGFQSGNFLWWFVAGFWAATAATSHLVAWGVAIAAGITWLIYAWVNKDAERTIAQSFYGIALGGAAGILLFLFIIDFRLGELFSFVKVMEAKQKHLPFFSNILSNFRINWTSSGYTLYLGLFGQLFAFLLFAFAFRLPREKKIQLLAWLATPCLTILLYALTTGAYRGVYQPSYGMLAYVSAFWAAGAAVASFLWLGQGKKYIFLSNLTAFALVGFSAFLMSQRVPTLEKVSYGWVEYADYERQVLDTFPKQAYVWGSANFGFSSGVRTDLLDSNSALAFGLHYSPEGWNKIAPDFLAFHYYTLETYFRYGPLMGKDSPVAILSRKLPHESYQLIKIVYAPPYGNTFIYKKRLANEHIALTVAANSGTNSQWLNSLDKEFKPNITQVEPITLDASSFGVAPGRAHTSLRIELEKGFYLVRTRVPNMDPPQTGAVVASAGPYAIITEDVRLQHAPLFRGQIEGAFIIDHLGGPLYLSYFPGRAKQHLKKSDKLELISIARFQSFAETDPIKPVPLPDFSLWKLSERVRGSSNPSGEFLLETTENSEGPLLVSPEISVKPHQSYTLEIPAELMAGGMRIGVINNRGNSLLYGGTRPQPSREGFATAGSDRIAVQIFGTQPFNGNRIRIKLLPGSLKPQSTSESRIKQILACPTAGVRSGERRGICTAVTDEELQALEDDLKAVP